MSAANGRISRSALMEAGNAHAVLHVLRICAERGAELLGWMRDSYRRGTGQRAIACPDGPDRWSACPSPGPGPARSLGPPRRATSLATGGQSRPLAAAGHL